MNKNMFHLNYHEFYRYLIEDILGQPSWILIFWLRIYKQLPKKTGGYQVVPRNI